MEQTSSMEKLPADHLKWELKRFLEAYLNTKILEAEDGQLTMQILHAKNSRNSKIKDKMINFMLLRIKERLLTGEANISVKDYHVCEFLIEELRGYVKNSLN